MKDDEVEVAVQINGKTKMCYRPSRPTSPKKMRSQQGKEALGDKLTGNIIKEIYVPKQDHQHRC